MQYLLPRWLKQTWASALLIAIFIAAGQSSALAYVPALIEQGQVWRLVTGHLSHLSWQHTLLNSAGLLLFTAFAGQWLCGWRLLAWCFFLALSLSFSFYCFLPWLENYVGFSGVIHGLFILLAFKLWQQDRLTSIGLGLIVAIKVFSEVLNQGSNTRLENFIQGNVIIQAHAYGAFWGGVGAVTNLLCHHLLNKPGKH